MSKYLPGQSGNPKGRPVGLRDWRYTFKDTIEKLEREGHDPVLAMINMAKFEEDAKIRFLANKELMARIAPPIKAITIDANINDGVDQEEFKNNLKAELLGALDTFKKDH